jgi:hypothetical protein
VLKTDNLSPGILPVSIHQNTVSDNNEDVKRSLEELISVAYKNDLISSRIIEAVRNGDRHLPPDLARLKITLSTFTERDGKLFTKDRLFVPGNNVLRLQLLRSCHDNAAAGHPGRAKTYELISRNYYWPRMNQTVRRYVCNCHTCTWSKVSQMKYQGLLQPLSVLMTK